MTTHIALLRAVNVGGHGAVAMAALRALATELGLEDARTLLQSGNLVFRSGACPDTLERLLETEAAKRLDVRTDFFVRTAMEWGAIVEANPFRDEAKRDPSHLVLMALKEAPAADSLKALQAGDQGTGGRPRRGTAGLHHLSRRNWALEAHQRAHREEARHARDRAELEHGAEAGRARSQLGRSPAAVISLARLAHSNLSGQRRAP